MSTGEGVTTRHESPRSRTHTRGQRFSVRPADGEPPAVRRPRRRTNSAGDGSRKGERRPRQGDGGVDQAPVGIAENTLPAPLDMDQPRRMRLENEGKRRRTGAARSGQSAQQGQLRPHVPRGSARQQAALLVDSQRVHALKIQLDARRQRRSRLLQGDAVGGDVEIRTDRVPLIAVPLGIASQGQVHFGFPTPTRFAGRNTERNTARPHWPEPHSRPRRTE